MTIIVAFDDEQGVMKERQDTVQGTLVAEYETDGSFEIWRDLELVSCKIRTVRPEVNSMKLQKAFLQSRFLMS